MRNKKGEMMREFSSYTITPSILLNSHNDEEFSRIFLSDGSRWLCW